MPKLLRSERDSKRRDARTEREEKHGYNENAQ